MMMTTADSTRTRGGAQAASARVLLDRIRRLVDRAQSVPVVASEELEGDDLSTLRDDTFSVVEEAAAVLGDVLARYETADEDLDELDFSDFGEMCGEVERRMDDRGGVDRITSVAFVAQIGLRNRRQLLTGVGVDRGSDGGGTRALDRKWDLIAACSSAVREVLKSLSAVELAVAEVEGEKAASRYYVSELERALRIRRAYFTFRREVVSAGPPEPGQAARRLRAVGSAIAKLVGRPAYAYARVHDRWQVRQLQARIRAQLLEHAAADASNDPARVAAADVGGGRLYQDLANLAELMMQINLRAELREHDAALFADVLSKVRAQRSLDGVMEQLKPALGRDPELDALLLDERPAELGELIEILARCGETLARTPDVKTDGRARRRTDGPAPRRPVE